jgi:hypothetical protein
VNQAAREKAEKRIKRFEACKHHNMQSFTECCLDCGENIWTTKEEILEQEQKKYDIAQAERSSRGKSYFEWGDF